MTNTQTPPLGQAATAPRAIPIRGLGQVAGRLFTRIGDTNLSLVAAGVAFFGLLALFPAITAFVALTGLLLDPAIVSAEIAPMLNTLPAAAAEVLEDQITNLSASRDEALSWTLVVSLAVATFSASRGTLNLVAGLNAAYEEREARGFLRLQAMGLLLTLGLILGTLLTLVVVAVLPIVLGAIAGDALASVIVLLLRWPVLLGAAALGFAALYRFGPSRRSAKWRWITPGAAVAVALWLTGTIGFAWYVQTFGSYNQTFGALAGVIVLMLWLYLSSFALLLGALIDAELEAQTAKDTTIGPDRPMGARGATKADRCDAVT
ncbi:MAG: YihY/virulence factor BrkB family protein [Pseudomonadota bacterium]